MSTQVRLMSMPTETSFAPLGVLGYCLTRTDFFAPVWQELHLPLKTVVYCPEAKLLDLLVSILAGCRAVSQVNTRLCPDLALARAWGRPRFAEQATLPARWMRLKGSRSHSYARAVSDCFAARV